MPEKNNPDRKKEAGLDVGKDAASSAKREETELDEEATFANLAGNVARECNKLIGEGQTEKAASLVKDFIRRAKTEFGKPEADISAVLRAQIDQLKGRYQRFSADLKQAREAYLESDLGDQAERAGAELGKMEEITKHLDELVEAGPTESEKGADEEPVWAEDVRKFVEQYRDLVRGGSGKIKIGPKTGMKALEIFIRNLRKNQEIDPEVFKRTLKKEVLKVNEEIARQMGAAKVEVDRFMLDTLRGEVDALRQMPGVIDSMFKKRS